MDSLAKGLFAAVLCALVAAVPASASFPGKQGQLSYTSSAAGSNDGSLAIWVRSPFGGPARELALGDDSAAVPDGESVSDEGASWSPSGKRVVFARRVGGGNLRLFISESNFTRARAIPLPEGMHARSPSFAPDGRTIVFVEVISGGDPAEEVTYEAGWNVWTVRTDGSGLRKLGPGDEPIWSPRGGLIVFRDSCGALKRMRPDGSKVRTLVPEQRTGGACTGVSEPDFAPNGRRIVYSAPHGKGAATRYELFTVGVDGSGRRRITTSPKSNAYEPVWSPDGGSIAFIRAPRGTGSPTIHRVPAGGGTQRLLVAEYAPDLAWQPKR